METAVPRPLTNLNERCAYRRDGGSTGDHGAGCRYCWAGGAANGCDGCGHSCCGDACCQGGCGCWGRGASSRGCCSTAPPPSGFGHIVDQSGRPRRGKGTFCDRPSAQTTPGTILTRASCTALSCSASC